jgi:dihydrofolate reductase
MTISIIVAVANNGVIGGENTLLWRLSEDLKLFKARTSGHAIIMGRKTFESIGKPLPNRINIVISRNVNLEIAGCQVVNSLEAAVQVAKELSEKEEIFIIGGEKIYQLAGPIANRLYLTKVDLSPKGDAYFDLAPFADWKETGKQDFCKDEKNEADFSILTFDKN